MQGRVTMKALESQNRIRELMVNFVLQAKAASATGNFDLNKASETILIPLFTEVYGYTHLENLNRKEHRNFPGIDLGDEVAEVAFQVTGTSDSEKIKDALQKVVAHKHYEKYPRIIVYVLTEKQASYSGKGYDDIIGGRFKFDKERDILDYRDLLREIEHFQIDKIRKIENFLEANFGNSSVPLFSYPSKSQTESVFLNMLKVTFPKKIYVADVVIDMGGKEEQRKSKWRKHWRRGRKGKGYVSDRERIWNALKRDGHSFPSDWIYYAGKIITFHNLDELETGLQAVIDQGTIESLSSHEFYSIDENYERVFKSLLRQCLQQKLYHRRVVWQHEEGMFIFTDIAGEANRSEEWYRKRSSERDVYVRTMKSTKPDEILKCKHLAFEVQFRRVQDSWLAVIVPDWFFSFDGYRKHNFCAKDVKWLKQQEANYNVATHAEFIAYFLKDERSSENVPQTMNMFETEAPKEHKEPYPFLTFGEYMTFDNAPLLQDKLWLPSKENDQQLGLGL